MYGMYGCMDVWMYGCMCACAVLLVCMDMDGWMHGCMDASITYVCYGRMYALDRTPWMCGCMDVCMLWMYACMDVCGVWMYDGTRMLRACACMGIFMSCVHATLQCVMLMCANTHTCMHVCTNHNCASVWHAPYIICWHVCGRTCMTSSLCTCACVIR